MLQRTPEQLELDTMRIPDGIACTKEEDMTRQSDKDSCDINLIMKQYDTTGRMPATINRMPQYGDYTNVTDYQTALDLVLASEREFNGLPAHIRNEFDNDPGLLLDFVEDPANNDEAIEMGLLTAPPGWAKPVPKTPTPSPPAPTSNDPTPAAGGGSEGD